MSSWVLHIRNFVIFLVAVVFMSLLVPRPLPGYYLGRHEALRQEFDEVELLFVGSSNIRMLDVARFQEKAEMLGAPVCAVNLGVDGMWPQEAQLFLKWMLKNRPPKLRWVVLDLRPWKARYLPPPVLQTAREKRVAESFQGVMRDLMDVPERELWWHTPRATFRMLRVGWRTGIEESVIWKHARLGLQRFSPIGVGYQFVKNAFPSDLPGASSEETRKAEDAVNRFSIDQEEYEALLARVPETDPLWDRELTQAYIKEFEGFLDARGLSIIYLYPPLAEPGALTNIRELQELLPDREIWSFGDPSEFPELFDYSSRLEQYHLNAAGNTILADLLAERFAEYRQREVDAR